MTPKLLIAAALSFGLGTGVAMAQNDILQPDAAPGTTTTLPMGWEGPIGDAFFADPATGTLRPEGEVRANWQSLTMQQQAEVRTYCATVDTAANVTPPDDQMTTGSITPDDATHVAAIDKACEWIKDM